MSKYNVNRPGYKSTKTGWIPDDWSYDKFSEIGEVIMGQSPEGKSYNQEEIGIPLINGPTEFTERFPVKKQWTTSPTKLCAFGDILICVRGSSTGRINISNDNYCIGRGVAAIKAINNTDHSFLEFQLHNAIDKILKLTAGSTFPNIDSKSLKSLEICIPPLPEQKKIAEILSTWDEAIEKTQKLIQAKERRKKGLMQQLLTGKKRLPGFNGKWAKLQMHDVFKRITRKNSEKNTNVLTMSAQQGLINQKHFFNKSVASSILDNYFLLKKNEFAYNKSYSNGYAMGAIKKLKLYDKGVVTTLYICFKLKNESKNSLDFLEQYFEAGLLIGGLSKIAHEGGRAHGLLNVTPNDFFNLKLNVPPLQEQQAIAAVLSTADEEISLRKRKLEALKEQKKGLMQKLLTGEVRVKT